MKKLITVTIFLQLTIFANSQWQQTSLDSIYITCLVSKDTNIIAGTYPNSIAILSQNGNSWTTANNGLPNNIVIYSLAVNGTNIFVGTAGNRLYLSTNNGISWSFLGSGITTDTVTAIVFKDTNIFAGTCDYISHQGGIFKSANNGVNWSPVINGLTNIYILSMTVNGNYLFAGTVAGGVFVSDDNGASWTATPLNYQIIKSMASDGLNVYAGTDNRDIYISNDNGISWTAINNGLPLYSFQVSSILVFGTNVFIACNYGVFLSTNYGNNWNDVSFGLPPSTDFNSLAINSAHIFVGTNGKGVWKRPLNEMLTEINENLANNILKIYPNPSKGKFNIASHNKIKSIEVLNILGEVVFSTTLVNSHTATEIDMSSFSDGIYIVQVDISEKVLIEKIVLN